MPFISVSAPSIVSGMSGESEKTLRETFEEAKACVMCQSFDTSIDNFAIEACSLLVIHR